MYSAKPKRVGLTVYRCKQIVGLGNGIFNKRLLDPYWCNEPLTRPTPVSLEPTGRILKAHESADDDCLAIVCRKCGLATELRVATPAAKAA